MSIIRDVTIKARQSLEDDRIFLFTGARQAGKTTILYQLQEYAKNTLNLPCYFLNLEDPEYRSLLNTSPKNLFRLFPIDLTQRNVVLVDEVQYLENPSNFLKYLYDEYKGRLKFLVSGSSAFYLDERFTDALTGRKRIFPVLTLSFREFLRFHNQEELLEQARGGKGLPLAISTKEQLIRLYEEYMIYGGYPRVVLAPLSEKKELLRELAYSYIKKDIYEGHVRQEELFYRLLKILAGQTGQLVNTAELAFTLGVSRTTIHRILWIMRKSFHLAFIVPFYKNIRKELTKMPKVFFLDCGLRNFFLDNFKPFIIREDSGSLLENAVFRQLLENHDPMEIRFWRTAAKHEIDFIVENNAYEVKVSPQNLNTRIIKIFKEQYSDITIHIITFDAKEKIKDDIPIIDVWDL